MLEYMRESLLHLLCDLVLMIPIKSTIIIKTIFWFVFRQLEFAMSRSRDVRGGDDESQRMLIGNSLFSEFKGTLGEGETYQFLARPGMLHYIFLSSLTAPSQPTFSSLLALSFSIIKPLHLVF